MAPPERPRELRIGDAERTAAADELAEHYAQGRLSTEEHHERLDRVWAARTPLRPGAGLQRPAGQRLPARPATAYATADRPGVGQDRPRWVAGRRPFPGPPFGRPPFGRPPYAGPAARRFGMLPC